MADTLAKQIDDAFRSGALIDAALKQAAYEALTFHKKLGYAIVEWRDGRAVWTPAEQIELSPVEDPATSTIRKEPDAA